MFWRVSSSGGVNDRTMGGVMLVTSGILVPAVMPRLSAVQPQAVQSRMIRAIARPV